MPRSITGPTRTPHSLSPMVATHLLHHLRIEWANTCCSMGTELSLYLAVAVGIPWLTIATLHWSIQKSASVIPLLLLVPGLVTFAFRGGPAFWLTGIDVLQSDGRRASRWRCAVRGLAAWTPLMVFYMTLGVWLAKSSPPPGGVAYQFNPNDIEMWYLLGGICGGELLFFAFLLGAVYAVLRPQRGLQDLLAGTWLAPR